MEAPRWASGGPAHPRLSGKGGQSCFPEDQAVPLSRGNPVTEDRMNWGAAWNWRRDFDIRCGDAELGVCRAGSGLALVQRFPTLPASLWCGMVMHFLCHYTVEV